jgi:hypothetical protein
VRADHDRPPPDGAPRWLTTSVDLHAGRGIVGDRYFDGTGTFSASEKHGQQLTLIEAEVLDALREDGLHLTPADARRNIVARGIDLNALVGQEFQIGAARCIGDGCASRVRISSDSPASRCCGRWSTGAASAPTFSRRSRPRRRRHRRLRTAAIALSAPKDGPPVRE